MAETIARIATTGLLFLRRRREATAAPPTRLSPAWPRPVLVAEWEDPTPRPRAPIQAVRMRAKTRASRAVPTWFRRIAAAVKTGGVVRAGVKPVVAKVATNRTTTTTKPRVPRASPPWRAAEGSTTIPAPEWMERLLAKGPPADAEDRAAAARPPTRGVARPAVGDTASGVMPPTHPIGPATSVRPSAIR